MPEARQPAADFSFPCSAKVKNGRSYNSILPYAFMAHTQRQVFFSNIQATMYTYIIGYKKGKGVP
jgi:hypothetical protein